MKLSKVVDVDKNKCVNCHKCISVCPVYYCNDGSGDYIHLNHDLCIGCGECIKACSHGARIIVDDFDQAMKALKNEQNIVAVVAPAIAATFPDEYLKFNGWLKSIGVDAIFDVSFGAELTVKSYVEHIKENNPECVIAQPCPAIVSYIEIYHPELIQYLAPADSPMMHTMKMIEKFYPEYGNHKFMIISPCIAKKREFEEVGIGDYNVTFTKIKEYFNRKKIDLDDYPEIDFDNRPAERAVLFSTPGGLMRTAEREVPGISENTRKIEGPTVIYHYLKNLYSDIKKGVNPLLIDCLNCELGCNGGTGTDVYNETMDTLERRIENRNQEMRKLYEKKIVGRGNPSLNKIRSTINRYWDKNLYHRSYIDLTDNYKKSIRKPTDDEIRDIYHDMHKTTEDDIKNCPACGYDECKRMAIAIYNKLNKPENCHFFLQKDIKRERDDMHEVVIESRERMNDTKSDAENAITQMKELIHALAEISENSNKILSINKVVNDISFQTNLLALNASIEASRAGEMGKGFEVVAEEVKNLAQKSGELAKETTTLIENAMNSINNGSELGNIVSDSIGKTVNTVEKVSELLDSLEELEKEY